MSGHHVFRAICLSVLSGAVLCGCAAADTTTLNEARKFPVYPVYYAGHEIASLPLEEIGEGFGISGKRKIRKLGRYATSWSFIYGTCTPSQGSEGGCGPPLEIQNYSTCVRWFTSFTLRKRGLYDFNGAKATGGGGRYELSPMEIFTGRTTIVIFGNTKNIIKSAARALRSVRQARAHSRLQPPAPGSLQGKLRCQHRPI